MKHARIFTSLTIAVLAMATPAFAQESAPAGSYGVGIAQSTGGVTGLELTYDAGPWYASALTGLRGGNGESRIDFGGEAWWKVHRGASADFALGGGLGIDRYDRRDSPAAVIFGVDLGFKIRVFVTPNVAVGAFGGLAIAAGDADGFELGGEPIGAFSLTYFF